jgi:hypothetical protein
MNSQKGENNFLVPPIYSVVRVIKHLVYCKAIGTLIIPRWVSAPYWRFNFKKHMKYQNYVTDESTIILQSIGVVHLVPLINRLVYSLTAKTGEANFSVPKMQ